FAIELLCCLGVAALVGQGQHGDHEHILAFFDGKLGADGKFAAGAGFLAVHFHLSVLQCLLGETAGLEKTRSPQPLVDAYVCVGACDAAAHGSASARSSTNGKGWVCCMGGWVESG